MRKVYDEKYREESVKYYLESGKSLDVASRDLNVGKSTLFKWASVQKWNRAQGKYKSEEKSRF